MNTLRECTLCKLQQYRSSKSLLLTLKTKSGDNKHLLNPTLIDTLREYLDEAKSKATKGSVLITTSEGESFCEGFDYSYAKANAKGSDVAFQEMIDRFKHVVGDLISLPMPTIAAINGLATEAGLMLAISHDYLTMKPGKFQLRVGMLAREMSLPGYFAALIRSKIGSPLGLRSLVLRDVQIDASYAEKMGVLDFAHEVGDDAVKVAETLAEDLKKKLNGEVYAEIRKALYPELCKEFGWTCRKI